MVRHHTRYASAQGRWVGLAAAEAVLLLLLGVVVSCGPAHGPTVVDAVADPRVDEAAVWSDRMLAVSRQYFDDEPYSILMDGASTRSGPTVKAQAAFRGTVEGEVWWEGELLTTAPTGCAPGLECQDRDIDGTLLTFRFVEGGEHDGWAWVSYDGRRVRSRVLLEPSGGTWPILLERVASFLAHPFWQDLPVSQSVQRD